MNTLFGITFIVLYLLKLSAGKGYQVQQVYGKII